MSITGEFRPVQPPVMDAPHLSPLLQEVLELVEDLTLRLQRLDALMLTGKPNEISEASASVEAALNKAAPAFAEISDMLGQLGASNLLAASAQLRHIEQMDTAALADALRGALNRFAKRSISAGRRAQQLNRGLSAALRSLQALGAQEAGRLIAEA